MVKDNIDDPGKRRVEMLDVEDEDDRLKRIESSLFRLNTPGQSIAQDGPQVTFGDTSKPHFVAPPSELLSRVQAFLPALAASNQDITRKAQEDPDSVNMEVVTETSDQYIQMNLGLGVYEQRRQGSSSSLDQDKEMSTSSSSSASSRTHSDADDSDSFDSDEDSDDAEIITCFVPSRPIKPLPKRRLAGRPQIVVLGQGDLSDPSVASSQE